VPSDASVGPLDDVVDVMTDVPGEERISVPITGAVVAESR